MKANALIAGTLGLTHRLGCSLKQSIENHQGLLPTPLPLEQVELPRHAGQCHSSRLQHLIRLHGSIDDACGLIVARKLKQCGLSVHLKKIASTEHRQVGLNGPIGLALLSQKTPQGNLKIDLFGRRTHHREQLPHGQFPLAADQRSHALTQLLKQLVSNRYTVLASINLGC